MTIKIEVQTTGANRQENKSKETNLTKPPQKTKTRKKLPATTKSANHKTLFCPHCQTTANACTTTNKTCPLLPKRKAEKRKRNRSRFAKTCYKKAKTRTTKYATTNATRNHRRYLTNFRQCNTHCKRKGTTSRINCTQPQRT